MVMEHTTPVIRAPDLAYQDWDGCHECTQTVDELQRALSECSLSTYGSAGVASTMSCSEVGTCSANFMVNICLHPLVLPSE